MTSVPDSADVIAAFDVGSNSIKMTVARHPGENPGDYDPLVHRTVVTRLGESVEHSGQLDPQRVYDSLMALSDLADEARSLGASRLLGVATEATRLAGNGPDFLERVRKKTGIEIVAITGDHEAALTFAGLDPSVDTSGQLVVADIGGASTELITAKDGALVSAVSLPIGSGRLQERCTQHDPPTTAELTECQQEAGVAITAEHLPPSIDRLAITGGTGTYMHLLADHDGPLSSFEIDEIAAFTTEVDSSELASRINAPQARARVLPAGIAIVQALVVRLSPAEIVTSHSGVRRGLLLAAFAGEL